MGDEKKLEKIVSLAKRRGFIFQGSEIYGGLSGTWDYGPRGVELRNNIRDMWWKRFVKTRSDMYGVDAAILMNEKVWEASGHVSGFVDPLAKCDRCNFSERVDHLEGFDQSEFKTVEKEFVVKFTDWTKRLIKDLKERELTFQERAQKARSILSIIKSENLSEEQKEPLFKLAKKIIEEIRGLVEEGKTDKATLEILMKIAEQSQKFLGVVTREYLNRFIGCPNCGSREWSSPEPFNMMFKTNVGAQGDAKSYLRPETAQGMFVNFANVMDSVQPKLPFGIAQIGKAFRNEIAPRDFLFRTREFEQMEIEYFVEEKDWKEKFEYWLGEMRQWIADIGLDGKNVHELEVPEGDRAHYSQRTVDFEYDFPFGRKELYGLAYRTDFDLANHAKHSGEKFVYRDEEGNEIIPHVIEPTFGMERTVLAVLDAAYTEDEMGGEKRIFLKLKPEIAPVRAAVFPLLKNKPELVKKAREVFDMLKNEIVCEFDDNGNIGKRYRRQDEIGTPACITIDFDTLADDTVTIRDRDTGEQRRVAVKDVLVEIKSA